MDEAVGFSSGLRVSELFGVLPVLKFRCHVRIGADARLPGYMGSSWRGMLGWEVTRLICPFSRKPVCRECGIRTHCPYFLLLEQKSSLPGLRESPRGYVIYAPVSGERGRLVLDVTLFGRQTRFLPVVVQALFRGQRSGLGAGRHPYEIMFWEEVLPDGELLPLPPSPEGCAMIKGPHRLGEWLCREGEPAGDLPVRLVTPVRLRKKGKYLGSGEMDWPFFFGGLVRRLEALLCLFDDGEPLGRELWMALQEGFRGASERIRDDLRWHDYARYSNRQRRKVPMGGLVGDVLVRDASPWFREWWRAAELVHVGKGTSMGLGKVEVL